jgi:hypothetical protein
MQEEGRMITAAEAVENMKAFATAGVRMPEEAVGAAIRLVEVFSVGSQVNIVHANQSGTVAAVCVYAGDRVQYQVAWWDGVTRRCEWLEAFEVEASEKAERMGIGFREE